MNTVTDTTATTETEQRLIDEIERIIAVKDRLESRVRVTESRLYRKECQMERLIRDTKIDFEADGFSFKIDLRLGTQSWGKQRKTRIYVSGKHLDELADSFSEFYEPYGEERPEYKAGRRVYRKEERTMITTALEGIGIDFDKIRHSQKAGCSMCPCSPGWIADRVVEFNDFPIEDIFITVTRKG